MDLSKLNQDISNVKPSVLRQFDHDISADPKIVKLTLGEPDFNVPDHIKQAAIKAIDNNESHYPYFWGVQELRDAASSYYHDKFGYNYTSDQIVVSVGATEGLAATFHTLFQPGDAVIIPKPAYPVYKSMSDVNHLQALMIDTRANGCVLTPEQVKQAIDEHPELNIRGVVITDPSNPTGAVYTEEQLHALVPVLRDNEIWVISDEIYGELTYGVKHYTLSKWLPDQTIVINGLSKSHAMTGWRLGFVFGPTGVIDLIAKCHQYQVTAATSIVQYAAIEAMTNGEEDAGAMRVIYEKRCNYLRTALGKLGLDIVKPQGAFYVFVSLPDAWKDDSMAFAKKLAKEQHVGVIPGAPFGDDHAIRISYAASDESIHAAVAGLKAVLEDIGAVPVE